MQIVDAFQDLPAPSLPNERAGTSNLTFPLKFIGAQIILLTSMLHVKFAFFGALVGYSETRVVDNFTAQSVPLRVLKLAKL